MSTALLTPAKAIMEAPVFEGWWHEKFEAWFFENGARLAFTADVPEDALGSWYWEEHSCRSPRLILNINAGGSGLWGLPSPKHHGDWGKEAAIAHMILHIEDGTKCEGADPQDWSDYERELDIRAMARMGWTSWKALSMWDETLQQMVDRELQHAKAHAAPKSSLRRRSTARQSVNAGRR